MKKTFHRIFFTYPLLILTLNFSACSLPTAGPRISSLEFETKAPNICFRLVGEKSDTIKLAGIEFIDKSAAKKVWEVGYLKSHVVVNQDQCIPYGKKFAQENVVQPAAKLIFGHVYDVGISGDLLSAKSESYRQYSGMFCITKSPSGRPVTHTLSGSNGFSCPVE